MKKKKEGLLRMVVRKNFLMLRKSLHMNQEDLTSVLRVGRSGVTKKETGETPITLDNIEAILKKNKGLTLADFFRGYPGFEYVHSEASLDVEVSINFPWLNQVIMAANQMSVIGEAELEFLEQTLLYALAKVREERLGLTSFLCLTIPFGTFMMSSMVKSPSKNRQTALFMRNARKALRLTQRELAKRLGKNRDNIAKYETGATNTPGDVILKVTELMDCDIQI